MFKSSGPRIASFKLIYRFIFNASNILFSFKAALTLNATTELNLSRNKNLYTCQVKVLVAPTLKFCHGVVHTKSDDSSLLVAKARPHLPPYHYFIINPGSDSMFPTTTIVALYVQSRLQLLARHQRWLRVHATLRRWDELSELHCLLQEPHLDDGDFRLQPTLG